MLSYKIDSSINNINQNENPNGSGNCCHQSPNPLFLSAPDDSKKLSNKLNAYDIMREIACKFCNVSCEPYWIKEARFNDSNMQRISLSPQFW